MEFNGLVSKRVSRNADPFMFLEGNAKVFSNPAHLW